MNTNHTRTVVHVNEEMHIEIGTSSNFAFAFTVAIKETRDHQLQPPTKICTKYMMSTAFILFIDRIHLSGSLRFAAIDPIRYILNLNVYSCFVREMLLC